MQTKNALMLLVPILIAKPAGRVDLKSAMYARKTFYFKTTSALAQFVINQAISSITRHYCAKICHVRCRIARFAPQGVLLSVTNATMALSTNP